ncbi:hypothetical protein, partial [Rhizobium rhizogenes]|uniref:hypothetical protein n=1 Tax=Rhizobium rhizogenes TaxID=359 RepID=UPI001AEBAA06
MSKLAEFVSPQQVGFAGLRHPSKSKGFVSCKAGTFSGSTHLIFQKRLLLPSGSTKAALLRPIVTRLEPLGDEKI